MPASALDRLSRLNVAYPMMFRVTYGERVTHCGVLEFSAPEGIVYLPSWVGCRLMIFTNLSCLDDKDS